MEEENYYYLILKYLENSLSEEESDAFYNWVNACEPNKKLFFEAKAIYEAATSERRSINIENSWQRLLSKKTAKKNRVHHLWAKVGSYAAAAIFAVGLTSVYFIINKEKHEIVASCYIGGDGLEADVVILPDGTKVSLGSKTKFYYNSDYGQSFRNVFLEGEAYFEVKSMNKNPFIVNVNGMKVEALGTSFNVMAYPGDSLFIATLLEGSISLMTGYNSKQTILKPNQQFVYNKEIKRAKVENVNANDYIIWTSGYYYFYEQSLESILHRLGYVYGITSDIRSEKLKNTTFTGKFYRGQSLKELMEILSLSVPIKYKIEDHHVSIF